MSQALHLTLDAHFGMRGGDLAGLAIGLNVLLCSPSPMAASHPPLILFWMREILPEHGRFGGFPQISASSFSK